MINGLSKAKMSELSVVVVRADGSKEDLGVIAKQFSNPFTQLVWNIKQWFKLQQPKQTN